MPPTTADYASDYTSQKQKDDAAIIEKRKRMLQRFLTRLVVHPILKKEHVLHCFLDGNYTWVRLYNENIQYFRKTDNVIA